MSISLASLSEEIIDNIIRLVDDLPSLVVLVRVSKSINRLTLPHLYENVSLINAASDTGTRHLRSLTFLLLRSPQIASYVHTFTLRTVYATEHFEEPFDTDSGEDNWPDHPELDSVLRTAIEEQLSYNDKTVARPDANDSVEDDLDGYFKIVRAGRNEAATISILLPKLVNLRSMDVPFDFEYNGLGEDLDRESFFISRMFERALPKKQSDAIQPSFRHLRSVMIPGADDK